MAQLSNTGINGFISSAKATGRKLLDGTREFIEDFMSGFGGHGWKIWKRGDLWRLEIDELMIRKTMTVFELLIHKIRAVKGALAITQASGKVKSVTQNDGVYTLEIEEEMTFVEGDIVRCQRWEDGRTVFYHVPISGVTDNSIEIEQSSFTEGMSYPQVGDEIVQFGNISDNNRQSAIYLHADESGEPAIDVMFGIDSTDWSDRTKIRLGGSLPGFATYKGLYCENGMILSRDKNGNVMYQLCPDGSGTLAGGAISWNKYGELTIDLSDKMSGISAEIIASVEQMLSSYTTTEQLGETVSTIRSEISQSAQQISLSVKNDYSEAGLDITENGIAMTAGKVGLLSPIDRNEYLRFGTGGDGMPYIMFLSPTGQDSFKIDWTGWNRMIMEAEQASWKRVGFYLDGVSLNADADALNVDNYSADTSLAAWRFMAARTKDENENLVIALQGADYNGRYIQTSSTESLTINNDYDSSSNTPVEARRVLAPDGLYYVRHEPWLEDTEVIFDDDNPGRIYSREIIFGYLSDNTLGGQSSFKTKAVKIYSAFSDGHDAVSASQCYFDRGLTQKSMLVDASAFLSGGYVVNN